jgi:ATP-binding cassette subfamily C protein LapB
LLLKNRHACILLEWLPDGKARVRYPEGGQSGDVLGKDELQELYAGVTFFIKPVFNFDQRTPETGQVRSRHWFWGVVY